MNLSLFPTSTVCDGEGFSRSAADTRYNRAVTEGVNANTVLSPSPLVEAWAHSAALIGPLW